MRTKTNFIAVRELMDKYTPAQRGIVSDAETALIRETLEVETRDGLELDDVRDAAVMLYGQAADHAEKEKGVQAMMELMDAMSAVTAVIDMEKADREMPGGEVRKYRRPPRYAVAKDLGDEFMRAAGQPPFSADPADARVWPKPQDAAVMAGYAASQYGGPMSVVRIETCRDVFPVHDVPAETARLASLTGKNNGSGQAAGTGGGD